MIVLLDLSVQVPPRQQSGILLFLLTGPEQLQEQVLFLRCVYIVFHCILEQVHILLIGIYSRSERLDFCYIRLRLRLHHQLSELGRSGC